MNRRDAIKNIAGAGPMASACLGLGPAGILLGAERDDRAVAADIVRFGDDLEPLVRLIEETPRSDCIEVIARHLQSGLSYRELLSALFLAGIRNVSPQPPGFKFHCVFVLHSVNQLSVGAPEQDRLLPLLWSLDYFKQSQQRDIDEGDFQLRKPKGTLPSATQAWGEFHAAMDTWDEERADRAITAIARSKGADEVIEGLLRYGARDYRNIGHKAIFTASTWRTLKAIGWQHAEPALRSLMLGLLDFGSNRRLNGYRFEDQCHSANAEAAARTLPELPPGWASGGPADPSAAREVLAAVRSETPIEASAEIARMLADGMANGQAAWDGIHLAAGDLMLRLPGILGVHCVTSANALHYAYRTSGDAETRLYLLLQGAGWMGQFASVMSGDDAIRDIDLSALQPARTAKGRAEGSAEILDQLGEDVDEAARMALGYAMDHSDLTGFFQAARRMIFRKAEESHRFKYAAAIFEDLALVSPIWRPHMLATATYYLRGPGHRDSEAVERARRALSVA